MNGKAAWERRVEPKSNLAWHVEIYRNVTQYRTRLSLNQIYFKIIEVHFGKSALIHYNESCTLSRTFKNMSGHDTLHTHKPPAVDLLLKSV
jgi:hypothetical protein